MEAENKNQTPKEKFDAEMKGINRAINVNNAVEKEAGYSLEEASELEDQVDTAIEAMDKEPDDTKTAQESKFDKHVGTKKIEVTREQHLNNKVDQQREEILQKFNQIGGLQKENLSPFQSEVLSKVLKMKEAGTLTDPVLEHLVGKKIEVAVEYAKLNAQIKEVQLMIIEKMAKLATACTESQGLSRTYNRDILLYVQKNPRTIITDEENEGEGAKDESKA